MILVPVSHSYFFELSFLVSLSYYEYCDKELDDLSVGYQEDRE